MSVIATIPTTSVTVPTYIRQLGTPANGKLPTSILRKWGEAGIMFTPVSYALQAVHLAAAEEGIVFDTVGDYRPYAEQVALFNSRYTPVPLPGRPTKVWNGTTYWQKPGTAMAATPGTSNHGLGLANDICLYPMKAINDPALVWLRDNGPAYGWGLEARAEPWHWHWRGKDALSQAVVDTLGAYGVQVPSMAAYGFTVPEPTHGHPIPVPPTPIPGGSDMPALRQPHTPFDTRDGFGRMPAGWNDWIDLQHPEVQSATIHLTVVNPKAPGWIKVWDPAAGPEPKGATVDYIGGISGTDALVPLTGGRIWLKTSSELEGLIITVQGGI